METEERRGKRTSNHIYYKRARNTGQRIRELNEGAHILSASQFVLDMVVVVNDLQCPEEKSFRKPPEKQKGYWGEERNLFTEQSHTFRSKTTGPPEKEVIECAFAFPQQQDDGEIRFHSLTYISGKRLWLLKCCPIMKVPSSTEQEKLRCRVLSEKTLPWKKKKRKNLMAESSWRMRRRTLPHTACPPSHATSYTHAHTLSLSLSPPPSSAPSLPPSSFLLFLRLQWSKFFELNVTSKRKIEHPTQQVLLLLLLHQWLSNSTALIISHPSRSVYNHHGHQFSLQNTERHIMEIAPMVATSTYVPVHAYKRSAELSWRQWRLAVLYAINSRKPLKPRQRAAHRDSSGNGHKKRSSDVDAFLQIPPYHQHQHGKLTRFPFSLLFPLFFCNKLFNWS